MAEFIRLRELAFDRESKRTGKPEQLRVQLMQVGDGPKFATLTHFWRAESGDFCPPGKETLRITIKRTEAAEVIALLHELLDGPGPATGGVPARTGERPSKNAAPKPDANGFDARRATRIAATRPGACAVCGGATNHGDALLYDAAAKRAAHATCAGAPRTALAESGARVAAGHCPKRGFCDEADLMEGDL